MNQVPLFGIGNAARSVNVNAQDRLNLYVEINDDPEKHVLTLYPTPGKTSFVNFGEYPSRVAHELGNFMYVVNREKVWRVQNDGTTLQIGTVDTTSGRMDAADNGAQIMFVDGPNGYIYTIATNTFAKITDADFPGGSSVTFFNGRFIVTEPNTGRFYWSAIYDGTSWDALDFATAESDPDNLVRVFADSGQLSIFGEKTTEFWGDSGAADSPYTKISGGAVEWGLAARWSLAKFMDSLIFLRKNRLGQAQVCVMSGGSAAPVSNTQLETAITSYGDVSNATGFAYMMNGHPFYQITFPTVGKTWLFDGQSKSWSRLESAGHRDRAELGVKLLGGVFCTDYENGKLYRIELDQLTDDGRPIAREFTSRHQSAGDYTYLPELWLEMEAGVGVQIGQGTDPKVMLQISRDGGKTWGNELWRSIGKVGQYKARAVWNRLGRARDWVFRFRVSDPVKVVFVAAWARMAK